MPSQFFGLNIGYTGLVSAQAAINTTGNNIANVETKGYSRQEALQQAEQALRTNTTYGMAGAGVVTTAIEQIRNTYYDTKYWNNNANLGQYNIKQHYMRQIEDYFEESETVDGFTAIYGDFYNALSELQKNAGDETVRAQFISFAGNLTTYFNEMATDLTKLQEDTNAEIKNKADEINSIGSQIANLNKQINTIEITGVKANELRDQRALLIDQLSLIVDVTVTETPIYTTEEATEAEDGGVMSGANRYNVYIASQPLVDCYDYYTLSCEARGHKANQSDAEGLYELKWSNGLDFNLYGQNLGGELKGLIEMRDGNNEEYFNGRVSSVEEDSVTVEATASYLSDLSKCTLPDAGIIKIGNNEIIYKSWSCDMSLDPPQYTFEIDRNLYEEPTGGLLYKDAAVGTNIDYQGIPYYQEQLNEWVRNFAEAINKIELEGKDLYGDAAGVIFVAENITDNDNPYTFGDYNYDHRNTPGVTDSNDNTYYLLTAGNFGVSHEMIKDAGKLATTKEDISQGQDKNDLIEEMMTVRTDKDKMIFRGCSSEEFLQCITADIALNANSANTFQKNFQNIASSITNQRLSVSGVDNDEEALNLVKFQNAYSLASKMIQVMTEVYDRLILNTGV